MDTVQKIKKVLLDTYRVKPSFNDQIENAVLEAEGDGRTTFLAGRKEFCLISLGFDGFALAEVKNVTLIS